jgi:hypothetical protein
VEALQKSGMRIVPITIMGAIDEAGPGGLSRESERIASASFLVSGEGQRADQQSV